MIFKCNNIFFKSFYTIIYSSFESVFIFFSSHFVMEFSNVIFVCSRNKMEMRIAINYDIIGIGIAFVFVASAVCHHQPTD